jgi:PIN domain nuclease of toxin-antitoxin system
MNLKKNFMAKDDYILDTQVALWLMTGDEKLNEEKFKKRFLEKSSSRIIFHQVSTWEIQIKYSLGKLNLPQPPERFLKDAVLSSGLHYENIQDEGIFFLNKLPPIHRDPFDRLLIAHAASSGRTIVTSDITFQDYPIHVELIS